jgi:hypothetical protein
MFSSEVNALQPRLTAFGLLVGRLAVLQVTAVIHPVVEHANDKQRDRSASKKMQ